MAKREGQKKKKRGGGHLREGHAEGNREGESGLNREMGVSWHTETADSRAAFLN